MADIAIIGMGPRGLTVLERLVALSSAVTDEAPPRLRIHVIDPFPPGAGRVWRTDQSPSLLMNTTAAEQTVFADESCGVPNPDQGPSMAEWSTDPRSPDSYFPSRVEYGRYLRDSYRRIVAQAEETQTADVIPHQARVTDITEPDGTDGQQVLRLSDGSRLAVDYTVLCLGHIEARLTDERRSYAELSREPGVEYLPPCLPAETPVNHLKPGEPVVFRGFGLNYFDLQDLLTTGRGGKFTQNSDGSLKYHPSGLEPILVPSSRRGVPYRCKPITEAHPLSAWELRYFTPENIRTLADAQAAEGQKLSFNDHLWPLILADIRSAWYRTLYRVHPEAFSADPLHMHDALTHAVTEHIGVRAGRTEKGGKAASAATAAAAAERSATATVGPHRSQHAPDGRERPSGGSPAGHLTQASPNWVSVERRVLADPGFALDLHRLLRPMDDVEFADPDTDLREWMLQFLRRDLAAAQAGPEGSPGKAVFAALWAARSLLKTVVVDGLLDPVSFTSEVRGWFEGFVSGICDGPPPQRFAELIALTEAGLVDFIGPDVQIKTVSGPGRGHFVATSPIADRAIRATALVDASTPGNNVRFADDELMNSMLDRGQVRPAVITTAAGVDMPLTGLDVDGPAYRTVTADGTVHPRRFAFSIQLSAVQLGLAIAANPNAKAQSLIDANTIAQAIIDDLT